MKRDHAGRVAELVHKYGQMVFATAYRILGNADDADDAFQDVFVKLLGSPNDYLKPDAVGDWGAYLRVTASHCAVDLLRRKSNWPQQPKGLSEATQDCTAEDPHLLASQRQKAELLRQGLAALPKRDARAFALRYFEDFSYQEIAVQMKLSINQVGVILHRGRRRLRNILAPMVESGEPEIRNTRSIGRNIAKGD